MQWQCLLQIHVTPSHLSSHPLFSHLSPSHPPLTHTPHTTPSLHPTLLTSPPHPHTPLTPHPSHPVSLTYPTYITHNNDVTNTLVLILNNFYQQFYNMFSSVTKFSITWHLLQWCHPRAHHSQSFYLPTQCVECMLVVKWYTDGVWGRLQPTLIHPPPAPIHPHSL